MQQPDAAQVVRAVVPVWQLQRPPCWAQPQPQPGQQAGRALLLLLLLLLQAAGQPLGSRVLP